jgi:hypothetical protein
MAALLASVALFVKNPIASSRQVAGIPKEFVCELQWWEWAVKVTPGMKDVDPKEIPKDAKLAASVRIVRQIDTQNLGTARVGDIELRYLVLPEVFPEDRDGKVRHLQVFLSVHNLNAADDEVRTLYSAGGRVSLDPAKLGKREFFAGNGPTKKIPKASAFCVVIDDAQKLIKEIVDEQQDTGE